MVATWHRGTATKGGTHVATGVACSAARRSRVRAGVGRAGRGGPGRGAPIRTEWTRVAWGAAGGTRRMSEPAEHEEELRFPLLRHEVPPLSSSEPVPPAATAAAEEPADGGEVADGPLTRARIESATASEERQSAANATAGRRRREYTALSDSQSSSDGHDQGPPTPELAPAVQQLMSRGSAEVDAPERFPPLVQCRCLHTLCEYDVLCSHCAQGEYI